MRFPAFEDIVRLHDLIIERTGGEPGLLNPGALHSALDRCEWGPFPGEPTLAMRGAFVMRGIGQDHPFVDANKRTAFEATEFFLAINDAQLRATATDITEFMLAVARAEADIPGMQAWIQAGLEED